MTLSGYYIDDIAVGSEHTLTLTSDGDVWAWGNNGDGQLGLGHTGPVREPQLITGISGNRIKQVRSHFLTDLCSLFLSHVKRSLEWKETILCKILYTCMRVNV